MALPASPNQLGRPADSSLLQDNVAFVLCLDTVGRGDSLHLHVSKPPREGTLQHAFLRELEAVGALLTRGQGVGPLRAREVRQGPGILPAVKTPCGHPWTEMARTKAGAPP